MIRTVIQAGFGNQLFQYATGYALSRDLGQTLQLDISFFDDYNKKERDNGRINNLDKLSLDSYFFVNNPDSYWQYRIKSKFPMKWHSLVDKHIVPFICEDINNCREYQPQLFKRIGANGATFFGFWQNTQYFDKYLLDLKRQFRPNYKMADEVTVLFENIVKGQSVGVHIRRGDFVRLGWDKGAEYYTNGMDLLRKKLSSPHFFVVTDDTQWAKEQYGSTGDVTIIDVNTATKDIDEFFLLSSCHHQIISESTFGWWAAYLNTYDDKLVVVPETAKGQIFKDKWIRL